MLEKEKTVVEGWKYDFELGVKELYEFEDSAVEYCFFERRVKLEGVVILGW